MATVSLTAVQQAFSRLGAQFTAFFAFIAAKLKNFKNISFGEQIAFSCIAAGLVFLLIALILFIL